MLNISFHRKRKSEGEYYKKVKLGNCWISIIHILQIGIDDVEQKKYNRNSIQIR